LRCRAIVKSGVERRKKNPDAWLTAQIAHWHEQFFTKRVDQKGRRQPRTAQLSKDVDKLRGALGMIPG
jgi:hypothetical protein